MYFLENEVALRGDVPENDSAVGSSRGELGAGLVDVETENAVFGVGLLNLQEFVLVPLVEQSVVSSRDYDVLDEND